MIILPPPLREEFIAALARLPAWWTLAGRIEILMAAGMANAIPYLRLETTPRLAASAVVRWLEEAVTPETFQRFVEVVTARSQEDGGQGYPGDLWHRLNEPGQ